MMRKNGWRKLEDAWRQLELKLRRRNGEAHTCRRRTGELGPWPRGEGLDRWEVGTWTRYPWLDRLRRWLFVKANPGGGMGSTLWPGPGPVPRVCSFDGGIHPDDAIRLIHAGWEVGGTDKSYKRYLNPPGYRAHMEAVFGRIRHQRLGEPLPPEPPAVRYESPIPPVKVYVQHFSGDQIQRFNTALGGTPREARDE
jgi:hypothetical protein